MARCVPPVLAEVAWGVEQFDTPIDWFALRKGRIDPSGKWNSRGDAETQRMQRRGRTGEAKKARNNVRRLGFFEAVHGAT